MKKLALVIFLLEFIAAPLIAQNQHNIDSLTEEIKAYEAKKGNHNPVLADSLKVEDLYQISCEYWGNDAEKATDYADQCLALSQQIDYKRGIVKAYNSLGTVNMYLSNLPDALDYYQKALKIAGDLGDRKRTARLYGNIANIYIQQTQYDLALDNLQKAMAVSQELNDKEGVANDYNNMGSAYEYLKKYPQALENHLKSLKIRGEMGDIYGRSVSLNNIANVYMLEGDFDKAKENIVASIAIKEQIGDKYGLGNSYSILCSIYEEKKNFDSALAVAQKELEIGKTIGALDIIGKADEHLSAIYANMGNFKEAYQYHLLLQQIRDTVFNLQSSKQIGDLKTNFAVEKEQLEAKDEAAKESQRQAFIRNSLLAGLALMFLASGVFFFQRRRIAKEKRRSDELLLNILPEEVAEELKEKGSTEAKAFDEVTVIFTDFKSFTSISEKLSAKELVAEIDYCFKGFDKIMHKYNIEKIKTIGDSYMAAGGLPVANKTNAKDVVNAALEIIQLMENHKQQRIKQGKEVFEIRIGINSGPVVAGIVGIKKFAYDIWGDTVNLASRMESSGEAGKVNISGSTYELVKNDFNCIHRGKIPAKNKGEIDMYFVEGKSA